MVNPGNADASAAGDGAGGADTATVVEDPLEEQRKRRRLAMQLNHRLRKQQAAAAGAAQPATDHKAVLLQLHLHQLQQGRCALAAPTGAPTSAQMLLPQPEPQPSLQLVLPQGTNLQQQVLHCMPHLGGQAQSGSGQIFALSGQPLRLFGHAGQQLSLPAAWQTAGLPGQQHCQQWQPALAAGQTEAATSEAKLPGTSADYMPQVIEVSMTPQDSKQLEVQQKQRANQYEGLNVTSRPSSNTL